MWQGGTEAGKMLLIPVSVGCGIKKIDKITLPDKGTDLSELEEKTE